MEVKVKMRLFNSVNEIISIVMAASIVILTSSIMFVSCFQTDSFVIKNLSRYSNEMVDCVNNELKALSKSTGFPEKIYENAFTVDETQIIIDKLMKNFTNSYPTSFTDNSDLFEHIKANMTSYCRENNIKITNEQISIHSSLALDVVNEALGGASTYNAKIMQLVRSRTMAYFIVVPVFTMIFCIVALEFLNGGRHRKFNYNGMAITASGYILTFVSIFILYKKYVRNYMFCENVIYNKALADITCYALNFCMCAGFLLIIIGLIMLIRNYHYYLVKKNEQIEYRESYEISQNEYLNESENADEVIEADESKTATRISFD